MIKKITNRERECIRQLELRRSFTKLRKKLGLYCKPFAKRTARERIKRKSV